MNDIQLHLYNTKLQNLVNSKDEVDALTHLGAMNTQELTLLIQAVFTAREEAQAHMLNTWNAELNGYTMYIMYIRGQDTFNTVFSNINK
jgi:hypothetical protein